MVTGVMLLAGQAGAQSSPVISGARIRADMLVLSADSFAGRKPGTPGERLTTDYIIKQLAEAGVVPAAGKEWLQPVRLETRRPRGASLVVRGAAGERQDLSDAVVLVGSEPSVVLNNVPLAWGGYLRAEKAGKAEMAGALVLYRDSDPPGMPQPQPTDGVTRLSAAAAAGARGALAVVTDESFVRRKAALEAGLTTLVSDPAMAVRGIISESGARRLLAVSGQGLGALDTAATAPGFQATVLSPHIDGRVTTDVAEFTSDNVAGLLEGARQPGEYVLFTAHWDSFGHCRPGEADEICNGAIDNASGTAGLLELARAFSAGPRPDRSVIFLFTTAEEMGLAGSRQYTRTPLVPLRQTVAEFNLDLIALYGRGNTAGFVGAGLTDADSVFGRLVAAQGRQLDTGQLTRMVLRSSDAWSLLVAGVPSFILSGAIGTGQDGSKAFHDYLATRYHQPGDELPVDLSMDGAVEEVELVYAAGLYCATAGNRITFVPGSAFQRGTDR
jgi:Zn-dependent M28 family amino/carboxypeptidase